MKRKICIMILSVVFLVTIVIDGGICSFASTSISEATARSNIGKSIYSQVEKNPTYGYENYIVSLVNDSNFTITSAIKNEYYENIKKILVDNNGNLEKTQRVTSYARVIFAFDALGLDATNVGGYNLYDYITDYEKVIVAGYNAPVAVLKALNGRPIDKQFTSIKNQYIDYIISCQNSSEGGWAYGVTPSSNKLASDVDMTAMTIQALAPFYKTSGYSKVTSAVDKALRFIASKQQSNGGFISLSNVNTESVSQVIIALSSLGINPECNTISLNDGSLSLNRGSKNMIENLLTFYSSTSNKVGFKHISSGAIDGMATDQGYYALVKYSNLNLKSQTVSTSKTSYVKSYGSKSFYVCGKAKTSYTYKSSNTSIAKVNSSGLITLKGIGTATITVTAPATSTYKKATKTVKLTVEPKKQTIKKLSGSSKAFTVKWVKDAKASGYQIQYAKNLKFTKSKKTVTVGKNKTYSKKISKLSKKKYYYVKVRSYKTVGRTKIYGSWSTAKKIKTK